MKIYSHQPFYCMEIQWKLFVWFDMLPASFNMFRHDFDPIIYRDMLYHTIPYHTIILYHTILYHIVPCYTVLCVIVPYYATLYHAMLYLTILHDTILYHNIAAIAQGNPTECEDNWVLWFECGLGQRATCSDHRTWRSQECSLRSLRYFQRPSC